MHQDDARFLFVRLLLRKPDKWFRLEALRYAAELGTEGRLESAMEELCAYGKPTKIEPVLTQQNTSIKPKGLSIKAALSVKREPVETTLDFISSDEHRAAGSKSFVLAILISVNTELYTRCGQQQTHN